MTKAAAVQVNFRRLLAEKEVRENTRYTVAEVARGIGLSRTGAYAWMNGTIGTVRLETLTAICRFLDCQPGDLLTLPLKNGRKAEEAHPA